MLVLDRDPVNDAFLRCDSCTTYVEWSKHCQQIVETSSEWGANNQSSANNQVNSAYVLMCMKYTFILGNIEGSCRQREQHASKYEPCPQFSGSLLHGNFPALNLHTFKKAVLRSIQLKQKEAFLSTWESCKTVSLKWVMSAATNEF